MMIRDARRRARHKKPCGVHEFGFACKSAGSTTRTEFMHPTPSRPSGSRRRSTACGCSISNAVQADAIADVVGAKLDLCLGTAKTP
jgi:hypothetical protein